MKILLSDSNLITSSKIVSQLKALGWEVYTASRWGRAREVLRENPDIKVAVINLESFGGVEFLESLKQEYPGVKTVAYCGHRNSGLQKKAKELGAEVVVPNSVAVSSIVDLIKSFLQ